MVLLGDSAGGNLVTMAAAVLGEKHHGDGRLIKSLAAMTKVKVGTRHLLPMYQRTNVGTVL